MNWHHQAVSASGQQQKALDDHLDAWKVPQPNRVRKNCSSIPAIFLYTAMMNQSPEVGSQQVWHLLSLSIYIYSWCCCLPYLLPLTKNPINKFSSYIFCMGETIFGSYNWFGSRQKKEQADDSGDHVTYPQGVNKGGGGMKLFLKNILGFLSLYGDLSSTRRSKSNCAWRVRIFVE